MKAQVYAADGKIQIRQDGYTWHRSLPWKFPPEFPQMNVLPAPVKPPSLWQRLKAWFAEGDDDWFERGGW